jgi:hypothetical protein
MNSIISANCISKHYSNFLEIKKKKGYLGIGNGTDIYTKPFDNTEKFATKKAKFLSSFSKPELQDIKLILLDAYVYSYDLLEESILKSSSKEDLETQKKTIKEIRENLRKIANYIDSYESEILSEYKNI